MVSQDDRLDTGLKAVADATRRGILALLGRGQLSVQEIAESFPVSRPAISKHLRILREAGLVVERPVGRQRLYALERGSAGVALPMACRIEREQSAIQAGAFDPVPKRSSTGKSRGLAGLVDRLSPVDAEPGCADSWVGCRSRRG